MQQCILNEELQIVTSIHIAHEHPDILRDVSRLSSSFSFPSKIQLLNCFMVLYFFNKNNLFGASELTERQTEC